MNVTSTLSSKVLILGINPSAKAGKSKSLARLFAWAKYMKIEVFSFTNIIHKTGVYKNSDIDYNWITESCSGYDKIIVLGNFVSNALARINIPHHVLPHPSPLNRNLNDKEYEEAQLQAAMEYLWN